MNLKEVCTLSLILTLCAALLYGQEIEEEEYYSNTWVVELDPELSAENISALAEREGFINYGEVNDLYNRLFLAIYDQFRRASLDKKLRKKLFCK